MLAFVLFFPEIFFNSLPHKLTSESFVVGYCCQLFSWKTKEYILKLALPSTLWYLKLSNACSCGVATAISAIKQAIFRKKKSLIPLYQSLVESRLRYYNTIWDNCGATCKFKLKNYRAERPGLSLKLNTVLSNLMSCSNLGWLNVQQLINLASWCIILPERAGTDKMDYRTFRRKYLLGCLGKLGEFSKQQQVIEYNLSLYSHSFLFFSVSFSQSLVFPGRLCSKASQQAVDIVGLSQPEV